MLILAQGNISAAIKYSHMVAELVQSCLQLLAHINDPNYIKISFIYFVSTFLPYYTARCFLIIRRSYVSYICQKTSHFLLKRTPHSTHPT